MLYRDYLENPARTGENRLPPRTLLVPAQQPNITHENCLASDRLQCLDGDWRFCYLPEDSAEAFWQPELDDSSWDILPVPSMWQYHGYGSCLYPNVEYPFPYDPPHIQRDNPVGVYRCRFTPNRRAVRTVLRFLGVDNAYFVYLNGTYIGFSKGSRIAAEFDITDALLPGDNLLTVKVYTYSDASYLENQDMLLASGIFRSVYLVYTEAVALWDYTVVPQKDGFSVQTELQDTTPNATLSAALYDAEGHLQDEAETAEPNARLTLKTPAPHLWNAEDPYLYTLRMTVKQNGETVEMHTKRVGIRFTEVVGNALCINGTPIRLKGTNRHDNNPHEGKALTAAQLRADLTDIKACNLNAVRCAHYSQNPVFYEIASELGLYIMDEADCESHGAEVTGNQGALNEHPAWYPAFFDRISRMYRMNKNETCINIWSLGNEAGAGKNFDRCAAWLNEQQIVKPIAANMPGEHDYSGFRFTGYMTMAALSAFEEAGKPVMMIEYGHAMGNSPGGLQDIWTYIYDHPEHCGGYVWEYRSHGFYTVGKNGLPRYLYGGDFNDLYHWSNFSLDGYHLSDGTPKPTWTELAEISAPAWMTLHENILRLQNTWDFTAMQNAELRWALLCDGVAVRTGTESVAELAPHGQANFALPLDCTDYAGFCTLDVQCFMGEECLGHKAMTVRDALPQKTEKTAFSATVLRPEDGIVTVQGTDFALTVKNGMLASYCLQGEEQLFAPMRPNLWRAPTDNDGIIGFAPRKAGEWKSQLIHTVRFGEHETTVAQTNESVQIIVRGKILPQGRFWGFDAVATYTVMGGGRVRIALEGTPYGNMPETLPRIGVVLPLKKEMARVAWIGRGPGDSYPDRKTNAYFGVFDARIHDLNFAYDVPQETGNHEDTVSVSVYQPENGRGITVACDAEAPKRFAFSCHDMKLADLTNARHSDELDFCAEKYLYIDAVMRGIGSNSCGPDPEPAYELHPMPFRLRVILSPKAE